MNMYEGNHFYGMHLGWWFIWMILLFWIFFIPYRIPGQRKSHESALDILNKRLTSGQITNDEYLEKKKLITGK